MACDGGRHAVRLDCSLRWLSMDEAPHLGAHYGTTHIIMDHLSGLQADHVQVLISTTCMLLRLLSFPRESRKTVFMIDFGLAKHCGIQSGCLARAHRWLYEETGVCGSTERRSCIYSNEVSARSLSHKLKELAARKDLLVDEHTGETRLVPAFD